MKNDMTGTLHSQEWAWSIETQHVPWHHNHIKRPYSIQTLLELLLKYPPFFYTLSFCTWAITFQTYKRPIPNPMLTVKTQRRKTYHHIASDLQPPLIDIRSMIHTQYRPKKLVYINCWPSVKTGIQVTNLHHTTLTILLNEVQRTCHQKFCIVLQNHCISLHIQYHAPTVLVVHMHGSNIHKRIQ